MTNSMPKNADAAELKATSEKIAQQVSTVADQAVAAAGDTADRLTAQAGSRLQNWGDQVGEKFRGSGPFESVGQGLGQKLRDGGAYLEDAKFRGMVGEVGKQVRRNPIASIMIALGIGWCLARRWPR